MTTNSKYSTNTRALDATSQINLALNDLDVLVPKVLALADTVTTSGSAQALREMANDAEMAAVDFPAEMPPCERASYMKHDFVRELIGVSRKIARYQRVLASA